MSSPEKKRMKYETENQEEQKTSNAVMEQRLRSAVKADLERQNELKTLRRKNFVIACEKVSCEAYFDWQKRLQILNLPACAKGECTHSKQETMLREMPTYATETFNIEVKTGMWYDALEVCQVSIAYDQYLSAEAMKEVIEIMMNVHDDSYVNYTVDELIDKCQQVLAVNFSTHPPCPETLRTCYKNFLTTPMDLRSNTFTNREKFGCNEGIIKYSLNRLEDDIKSGSNEDPIVNKYENTPFDMKEGVQGLHWEKEKFEIFEQLERTERIKRLMAVLESVIELLQYDLAIWQTRNTRNMGSHIMNLKKRPLLAVLLWPTSVLNTGGVTRTCRQIIDLFIYSIHLQFPDKFIEILSTWLNTLIQIFYICETNSNSNYPNLGTYCNSFATKFYESMTSNEKGLPNDSVISIMARIQPSFMRYLIGTYMTKSFLELKEKEDNILKIIIGFIKNHQWKEFPELDSDQQTRKVQLSTHTDTFDMLLSLMEQCGLDEKPKSSNSDNDNNNNEFPKMYTPEVDQEEVVRSNHVVNVLYITLEAYLSAYSVAIVQDTLDDLNKKLLQPTTPPVQIIMPKPGTYSVSEDYIKKYRTIFIMLQELLIIKQSEGWPKVLDLFNSIPLLG